MITKQMTPFFPLLFEFYQLVYFIFGFLDLQNLIILILFFWSVKHLKHLHAKDDTFKPVNKDTLFPQIF